MKTTKPKRRMVTVKAELWSKGYVSKYEKGPLRAELLIVPHREGFALTSSLFIGGKRDGKADHFLETAEQVADRRKGLQRDGFKMVEKAVKVPTSDAPKQVTEADIARQQLNAEIAQLRRATTRGNP
jgi:hypothetical protein